VATVTRRGIQWQASNFAGGMSTARRAAALFVVPTLLLSGAVATDASSWAIIGARARPSSPDHAGSLLTPTSRADAAEASNVYVVDPNGRALRRLTSYQGEGQGAFHPSWSPNGKKIVFTEVRCDGCRPEIRVVEVAGGRIRKTTRPIALGYEPSFSPDGKRIAFIGQDGGLFIVGVSGQGRRRIVDPKAGPSEDPAWAPEGNRLLFSRRGANGTAHIHSVNLDGKGLRQLTAGRTSEINPAWSRRSNWIAFARLDQSGLWQIYAMKPNGTGSRKVSDGRGSDTSPAWSADGTRIVFVRTQGDSQGLYVVDANGRGFRRLTRVDRKVSDPAWSPRDGSIVFVMKK